jgi:flagellar assembly protein FliH
MSSRILTTGDGPSAAPVFWRVVTKADTRKQAAGTPLPVKSADPREEWERRLEQARREGFAEGAASARQAAEAEVRPTIEGLTRSVAELARSRERLREESAQELVRLAIAIAARVIHRESTIDPDALLGLVKAAFAKLQSRETQRARMHPALEPLVRQCLGQNGAPKILELVADPTLRPGDLFFDTAQGMLDASVDDQLREIERGLIDRMEL